jgi:transcription antitermination factor NusG
VIAKSGREMTVQAELAMAGWSTFLPVQTCWLGDRAKRRRINRPLFTRYLFAACNPGGDVAAASRIDGIDAVRRSDRGRSVVSLTLLGRLMMAEASHGFDLTYEKPRPQKRALVCGQSVNVRAGVLKGFDALIVKVLSERTVVARVAIFGSLGEVTFKSADLEPVGAPQQAA